MTAATDARPALQVHGLSKTFGRLCALDQVSFAIHRGEVVGLIGPNGAGKTTLLECIAGLQPCDSGRVVVGTAGGTRAPSTVPLFYVPDGITPWEAQRVGSVLDFMAAIHGAAAGDIAALTTELGLADLMRQQVGTLSRGQRKRVLLAIGLLTGAPLLLLDEPFDGLDVRQMRDVAAVLRRHAAAERTLFLSIHQLSDAARVCDRLVLLSNGAVVGAGTLDQLRQAAGRPDADLEELFLALTE